MDEVTAYWELLLGAKVHVLLGWTALWSAVAGFIGLVAGLGLFFALRRWGLFKAQWRFARLVRVLIAVVMVGCVGLAAAAAGGMEGALRTTPSMVRESNFGKEGLITENCPRQLELLASSSATPTRLPMAYRAESVTRAAGGSRVCGAKGRAPERDGPHRARGSIRGRR